MDNEPRTTQLWRKSAKAWITDQGEFGDQSRREILDPALDRLLGSVEGLEALDVGCGEGRYARVLAAKGASVTGIDPVPEFIDRARSLHPEGAYELGGAEAMPFPDRSFDLVLSYLSIVDIPDDAAASREMVRVLRPGGRLVLATISNLASTTDGWVRGPTGEKQYRTVDRYMECFKVHLQWRGIEIENFHRPLSRTLGLLLQEGLVITQFIEPLPSKDSPEYADEHRVPNFQIIEFRKPVAPLG